MGRIIIIALLSLMIPFSSVSAGWLDDVASGVRNVKDITDTTKDVVRTAGDKEMIQEKKTANEMSLRRLKRMPQKHLKNPSAGKADRISSLLKTSTANTISSPVTRSSSMMTSVTPM